jgi:hypothetical protein
MLSLVYQSSSHEDSERGLGVEKGKKCQCVDSLVAVDVCIHVRAVVSLFSLSLPAANIANEVLSAKMCKHVLKSASEVRSVV